MFYSQKGQDRWVVDVLGPQPGYFVDVGASDGLSDSNTYALEKRFGWSGICIEANPEFYESLKRNRNCHTSPSVITHQSDIPIRFRTDNGHLGGIVADDCDNNYAVRGDELEDATVIQVFGVKLSDVLVRYNAPPVIDYLSLDIEGAEERAIFGLDFRSYMFRCITIERPTKNINIILGINGYIFVKNFKMDSFYVHQSILHRIESVEPFEQLPRKGW